MAITNNTEFIAAVREMRAAQQQYFKYRTQSWLVKAKELEKKIDAYLKEKPEEGPKLFA